MKRHYAEKREYTGTLSFSTFAPVCGVTLWTNAATDMLIYPSDRPISAFINDNIHGKCERCVEVLQLRAVIAAAASISESR